MRNTSEGSRGTWATYVYSARRRTGLGKTAFGDLVGVDRGTVHRWEESQTVPTDGELLKRFADALALDLDEVLTAAGLKRGADGAPTEPSIEPDPELEQILNSGLPARLQREMIAEMERRRAEDQARRLADIERTIRLILGPGSKT